MTAATGTLTATLLRKQPATLRRQQVTGRLRPANRMEGTYERLEEARDLGAQPTASDLGRSRPPAAGERPRLGAEIWGKGVSE